MMLKDTEAVGLIITSRVTWWYNEAHRKFNPYIPVNIQQPKIRRFQAVNCIAASFGFVFFSSNTCYLGPGQFFCLRSAPLELIIMYTYVNGITLILCSRSQLLHDDIHTVIKNTQIALELKISPSTTLTWCDLSRYNTSMFNIWNFWLLAGKWIHFWRRVDHFWKLANQ